MTAHACIGLQALKYGGGTSYIKFYPMDGTDNLIGKRGSTHIKTRHYCTTGMRAYEQYSLEVRMNN